jgi:hypothetical protein
MPVRKPPHHGLKHGRRKLKNERNQPDLRKAKLQGIFDNRVYRLNQGLQSIVGKMGKTPSQQYGEGCSAHNIFGIIAYPVRMFPAMFLFFVHSNVKN